MILKDERIKECTALMVNNWPTPEERQSMAREIEVLREAIPMLKNQLREHEHAMGNGDIRILLDKYQALKEE